MRTTLPLLLLLAACVPSGSVASGAGEDVLLSDPDGVVDAFAFGEQTTDITLARIPDGTGPWSVADPTPGEANE